MYNKNECHTSFRNDIINNKIKVIKHLFLTYSLKETKEEVFFYGEGNICRRKN